MDYFIPLAHMPGQAFLVLYSAIFATLFSICMLVRLQIKNASAMHPLAPETDPDPYRIAYLRGGQNEVLRLATFELFAQGAVEATKPSSLQDKSSRSKWKLVSEKFDPSKASPFALEVSHFFATPRKPTEIFQSNVAVQLSDRFRQWDHWIEQEELHIRRDQKIKLTGIAFGLASAFFAIGLAKVLIAISNERHNVGYAIAIMIAGSIAILCTSITRKLNSRGRDYLSAVQTINSQYRSLAASSLRTNTTTQDESIQPNATNDLPIMAMGLFGVAALQASPFDEFRQTYKRSEANSSGCGGATCAAFVGSGCGSGASGDGGGSGCSGGGGCGGCGGGCGGS